MAVSVPMVAVISRKVMAAARHIANSVMPG